jgi:hypothetical protein
MTDEEWAPIWEKRLRDYRTPRFEVSANVKHRYSFVIYESLCPSHSFWIVPGTIEDDYSEDEIKELRRKARVFRENAERKYYEACA